MKLRSAFVFVGLASVIVSSGALIACSSESTSPAAAAASSGHTGKLSVALSSVGPDGATYSLEQGYIELGGRSSELFKVGGELVAPVEVERVLTSIDGVSQAFVAGIPDELYGDIGWAWVVPTEGASLDTHALTAHLREHLAPFKVPRGITLLGAAELPTTTTGKVQKYLLVQSRVDPSS